MKRVRIEEAGPYVDVVVYPISGNKRDEQTREAAKNPTGDFRQRVNDKKAAQKFRRLIACNFSPGDKVATLTYRDNTLPPTADDARKRRLRPFMAQLRKRYLDLIGSPLKYLYVTEGRHGDHRLHHHMIIPGDPEVEHLIRLLWRKYGGSGFETIASRGYDVWAGYLTKEPRKTGRQRLGDRAWTPSLGLKKPTVTTFDVDDGWEYELPPNVFVEHNETVQNEWYCCRYISYRRLPDAEKAE